MYIVLHHIYIGITIGPPISSAYDGNAIGFCVTGFCSKSVLDITNGMGRIVAFIWIYQLVKSAAVIICVLSLFNLNPTVAIVSWSVFRQ